MAIGPFAVRSRPQAARSLPFAPGNDQCDDRLHKETSRAFNTRVLEYPFRTITRRADASIHTLCHELVTFKSFAWWERLCFFV